MLMAIFNALTQQDESNIQAIHNAAQCGHVDVVMNLITKHGVDPKVPGTVSS